MDPTVEARFTRIYEAHYPAVLAYCGRRVSRAEAEDIAGDVFVVLWRRLDEVDADTTLAWLYGVAHRTITNRYRSTARQRRLMAKVFGTRTAGDEPIEEVVVRRDQDRRVLDGLAALSATDREVLRLSAWEQLSAPEIARVIGCSVSAAEQRLHRAKRRLAKVLTPTIAPQIAATPLRKGGEA